MGNLISFGDIKKCEIVIRRTWNEFRTSLLNGIISYNDIDKAKKQTFLKQYDDIFQLHKGIKHNTITIKELRKQQIGRGVILGDNQALDYNRFIPKAEYIKEDNRFSPPGVEWLYLATGSNEDIHMCAQAECHARKGDRFGFCEFEIDEKYNDCKLVDLTISDNVSYKELNEELEKSVENQRDKSIIKAEFLGDVPRDYFDEIDFQKRFIKWCVFTYTKLLSEQIFIPLDTAEDKKVIYAPFQTMAQYYISLGFSGIIYGSTICPVGENVVLFDKNIANPVGAIEDYKIS